MHPVLTESPVQLESLDDHLKALLRLKLREFVHLSPWFRNIPSIDPDIYCVRESSNPDRVGMPVLDHNYQVRFVPNACPNRKTTSPTRRRTRQSIHTRGF